MQLKQHVLRNEKLFKAHKLTGTFEITKLIRVVNDNIYNGTS